MRHLARRWFIPLAVVAVLSGLAPFAIAQDNGSGGEPIVPSIDPSTLTYDLLVDGNLPQDDPANGKFKTLQAAYAAAPAGTATRQTVIGIMPNVYFITGGPTTPGMTISKNYITLLGITNNRRSVVLADNRGNKQGAGTDTTSYNGQVVVVNATGFRAENLTFLNYCNVDYEYPGDSSKNLAKRSGVITQAVALQTSGDKHVFVNVAFLSRLDTTFIMTTRAYLKNVFIEGTDDFIGGGTVSVWEDSVVSFPTGNGTPALSGATFIRTRFVSSGGMQFYKGMGSPVTLVDCVVPVHRAAAPVAWVRGVPPPRPSLYSMTYRARDTNGDPAVIVDGSQGDPTFTYSRELSDAEALAFNPWNLLRATPTGVADDWDPAGVKDLYEGLGQGSLIYRMTLANASPSIRTGDAGATITATVSPVRAPDRTVMWSTNSTLVTLETKTPQSVLVKGQNTTEHAEYVQIDATAANGFHVRAWVYVEPKYIDPPVFLQPPTLDPPLAGTVHVNYVLDLGGREDQSLVSWFLCDDPGCASPRPVGVSRGNLPYRDYVLTAGAVGKYLAVSVAPKHNISDPGPALYAYAATPILASDITSTTESPNFRNFVTTVNTGYVSGLWTVLGAWTSSAGSQFRNGYGVRVAQQGSSLLYQRDEPFGDMRVRLFMTPEKTAGQGFGSPGSGADGATIQKSDVYIKYDPRTRNGYALRFWRTTLSAEKVMFQWYQIVNGAGSPLSAEQVLTGVFKPNTQMDVKAIGDTLTATAHNDVDDEVLNLSATASPNPFGGAGVYWSGTVPSGNSNVYSTIEVSYPELGWNLALSGTAVGANLPAGARVGSFSTSTGTDTFTYSLVAGAGADDNDAFTIDGDVLRTTRPLDAARTYGVRVRSTNQDGFLVERSFTITVVSVACAPQPAALWPPNGRAVPVTIAGAYSPDAAGIVAGTVRFAVADEYSVVQPTGSVAPDAGGSFTFTVPLTAFRRGDDRDGREYRVVVSGTDTGGNTITCTASVTVPHDQR